MSIWKAMSKDLKWARKHHPKFTNDGIVSFFDSCALFELSPERSEYLFGLRDTMNSSSLDEMKKFAAESSDEEMAERMQPPFNNFALASHVGLINVDVCIAVESSESWGETPFAEGARVAIWTRDVFGSRFVFMEERNGTIRSLLKTGEFPEGAAEADRPVMIIVDDQLLNNSFATMTRWCELTGQTLEQVGMRDGIDYTNRRITDESREDLYKRQTVSLAKRCVIGVVRFLLWVNSPDSFIVRSEPKARQHAVRKKQKKREVRGTHLRDIYTVLEPEHIKTRYVNARKTPEGTHASPIPHLRRGHYKTLRSPVFRRKQGQRVWVPSTHVKGKTVDWVEGERRYVVM